MFVGVVEVAVKLLNRSRSGVLRYSEIVAMKIELRNRKSFIYRRVKGDEKGLDDWRKKRNTIT